MGHADPTDAAPGPGPDSRQGAGVQLDWQAEPSRAGELTLRIGDRWVHSRYAPRREAADLARATRESLGRAGGPVLLLGLGLGYVAEALGEALDREVVGFDPFPEMTQALPGADARSGLRMAEGYDELEAVLGESVRRGSLPHVIVHPGYQELCRFEARFVAARLRALIGKRKGLRASDAIVSRRALDALVRMPYRADVSALAGCCAGRTAICVAPGPSLDASALDALRRREGGVVFAALQALRPLQEAGVAVDFVVAPDPHDFEPFVRGLEPRFGALLADSSVHPELLDRWPEKTALFHLRTPHLHQLAWEHAGLPVLDEPVTTVSETMLALADSLGAARFVLVGMDFCGEADRYRQLSFTARDGAGRSVVTNGHYLAGARFLSHRCPKLAAEGRPVVRLGRGLPIGGVRPGSAGDLSVRDEPPLGPPGLAPARSASRWQAACTALEQAARARGPATPAPPRGDREASRRMEDFHPLAAPARGAGLSAAAARLAADPVAERS